MAFVVTDGRLSAIGATSPAGWYGTPGGRSIRLSQQYVATYAELYRAQPAIQTVVSFLARNLAGLGLHAFERVDELDRVRLRPDSSPLAELLGAPNPSTTPYRFWYSMIADKAIYDVAYAIRGRGDGGTTRVMRRISPRRIRPLGGDWFEVNRFRITGTRGHMDVDRDDLFILDGYDPDSEIGAVSPIESLRHLLAEEWAATEYRAELWARSARMSGYITRPSSAPEWGDTARKRFREEWRDQYAQGGSDPGGTPILEDDMAFVPAGVSPKDAQYVESRTLTREEVAAAYHIPPPMVGLLEHATYSNIKEQHKQTYQDTLGPWAVDVEQAVDMQLVPDLTNGNPGGRVYVEFNIASKLAGSFEEQAAVLATAVGRPYMVPDEARARLNLPQLGGNAAILLDPLNMGGAGDPGADVEGEPGEEITAAGKARARFRARRGKHKPGGHDHDQSDHGNGGGGDDDDDEDAPRTTNVAGDKLKIAGTIELRDGEQLIASRAFTGSGKSYVAITVTDGRPQMRFGVNPVDENFDPVGPKKWESLNKFEDTALLGPTAMTDLYSGMPTVVDAMAKFDKDLAALDRRAVRLEQQIADTDDVDKRDRLQAELDVVNDEFLAKTDETVMTLDVRSDQGGQDLSLRVEGSDIGSILMVSTNGFDESQGEAERFDLGQTRKLSTGLRDMIEDIDNYVKSARPGRRRRKAIADPSLVDEHVAAITEFFERQGRSVRARAGAKGKSGRKATVADVFDSARWNRELSADLLALAQPAAEQAAVDTLDALGLAADLYDPTRTAAFLAAQTSRVAESANAVTEQQIEVALEAPDVDLALAAVFAAAVAARALSLGRAQATAMTAFGTVEAPKHAGLTEALKTWVTGPNPRPTHAAMDGETVPISQKFSNGAEWPADAVNLDVDEVAGCNCSVTITQETA